MSENHDPGRTGSPRAHAQREKEEREAMAGRKERPEGPDAAATAHDAGAGRTGQEEPALGFRQAMEELEDILERIEGEEIDIDQLAQELRRAAQLLDLCRGKIRRAEVEVTQIVQSLSATGESGASGDESADDSGESGDEGGRRSS